MSVSKAFTLYAASLNASGSNTLINQMENQDYDAGIEQILIQANGSIYPQFIAEGLIQPKLSFTTSDLYDALAQGMLGYEVGAGFTNTSAVFTWRQYQAQGGLLGGSVQLSQTMNLGAILPRRLSARTGERATLDMEVIPLYNGTDSPFVVANGVALPAGTSSVSHVHTAGPAIINGVTVEGIQSLDIDFGIRELLLHSDGEAYNSFLCTPSVMPSISFETYDMSLLASLGNGTSITSETTFFLTAIQAGGTRVPYATAQHIGITVTEGMLYVESGGAKPGEAGLAKVKLQIVWDGTNAPMQFNTATAIVL